MSIEHRRYPRFQVTCPLVFAGDGVVGAGRMTDLSVKGCAVESDVMVVTGLYLEVRILLPDSWAPLRVDLAPVRWAVPGKFGIELIKMEAHDQLRLTRFIQALSSVQPASDQMLPNAHHGLAPIAQAEE